MNLQEKIQAFRKELPIPKGKLFFNHGVTSPAGASVVKAAVLGARQYGEYYRGDAPARTLCRETKDETRRLAAGFIGAAPENIAFTMSTSFGLSLVALAMPWRKGDNVVTGFVENPATIVPWLNRGIKVKYLPADRDDLIDLGALPKLVDRRTRLVALSLVEYSTGQRMNLRKVVDFCRPRGIMVSVDAVQAVGAVPVDVKALGVNFLSCGALKWLMGPVGIGFLYVDDEALQRTRCPFVTEGNTTDIKGDEEEPTTRIPQLALHPGALKYEAQPFHHFAGIFGLGQALKNLNAVGKRNVWNQILRSTDHLVDGLGKLEGRVISPRGQDEWSGLVSFAPGRGTARDLVNRLRRRNVSVALRKGRIRISPHFYNSGREIDAFLDILKEEMG